MSPIFQASRGGGHPFVISSFLLSIKDKFDGRDTPYTKNINCEHLVDPYDRDILTSSAASLRGGENRLHGLFSSILSNVEMRTKLIVLCMMSLQNASVILTMRYSRIRVQRGQTLPYSSNMVILLQELAKLPISFIALSLLVDGGYHHDGFSFFFKETSIMDVVILIVPSLMYYFQNRMVHVAIQRLTAASFVIAYQLKLVFSTVLSELIFRRGLTATKWSSVVALFVGVSLVQLESVALSSKSNGASVQSSLLSSSSSRRTMVGLSAAILGSWLSALAGVYMEFVMKRIRNTKSDVEEAPTPIISNRRALKDITSDLRTKTINMWLRNTQLAMLGSLISLIPLVFGGGHTKGHFEGFDSVVWSIVALQALGGLAVSASLIYADSVLKGFATSVSLLVVGLFDSIVLHEKLGGIFWSGASVVVASVWAYSQPVDYAGRMLK